MNTAMVASPVRSRLTLLLIFAIFLAPMVGAWVMYTYFPDAVRSLGTKNHGSFVVPTRPIALGNLTDTNGNPLRSDLWRGKWTYVFIDSSHCDDACKTSLHLMRQVRLVQGEEMGRVERLFVVTDTDGLSGLHDFLATHQGMIVAKGDSDVVRAFRQQFDMNESGQSSEAVRRIYLVDPRGELMMFYDVTGDPLDIGTGMRKDLKKLLHDSKRG